MDDQPLDTTQMNAILARIRTGDREARDELLRRVCGRLERLARKMLRQFPNVRRWSETGDVLQSALMRFLRALEKMELASTRDFFNLAAVHIRRELIDLARHFYGPQGHGTNLAGSLDQENPHGQAIDPASPEESLEELDHWCQFHQAVENLPPDEREVLGLIFYHGWSQAEVAQLLQTSTRSVRRRWASAMVKLQGILRDEGLAEGPVGEEA